MITYEHVAAPVRKEFAESHQRFWDRLAAPGTWWTGAQRVAIAREARSAADCAYCKERKAALSPHTKTGRHGVVTDLSPCAIEVVHSIMNDASRLTRKWYASRIAEGLSEGQYVEIVGTVVAVLSIDRFCRGVGVAEHPFPLPLAGDPSRYRPASAATEAQAWVPLVPSDNSATPEADLWPAGKIGNVIRAMSVVPDEVRTLNDLGSVHYLPSSRVRDPGASQGSLSRSQMELVAGRVSALNDCYY